MCLSGSFTAAAVWQSGRVSRAPATARGPARGSARGPRSTCQRACCCAAAGACFRDFSNARPAGSPDWLGPQRLSLLSEPTARVLGVTQLGAVVLFCCIFTCVWASQACEPKPIPGQLLCGP